MVMLPEYANMTEPFHANNGRKAVRGMVHKYGCVHGGKNPGKQV